MPTERRRALMNNIKEFSNSFLGEKYYIVDHESGLRIFVFPKERQSSCAILATEFGSSCNRFFAEDGEVIALPDGIAHFMEHKMFDNPDGVNVDDVFSKLGGDPNAYTCWDHTAYFYTSNSDDNFYKCLEGLISFVTSPYFTDESVEKEQGIIGQEIAMCEDDPYDRCFLGMVKGLYKNHPIRIDVVGSERSIATITPKMLYDCHERFYSPSNMVLALSGVVEPERVLEIVDNLLPKKAPAKNIDQCEITESDRAYKKRTSAKMQVERSLFCIGFKDTNAPDEPTARRKRQIIAELLMGIVFASSNELYTSLFKRGIMTTPFNYGEEYGKTYSLCYAGGECDDPDLLLSEIKKYIKKLIKNGIDPRDFERRKRMAIASDIRMFDSTWDIANAMVDNAFAGVDIFDEADLVSSVTLADVEEYLADVCKDKNITFSTIDPQ